LSGSVEFDAISELQDLELTSCRRAKCEPIACIGRGAPRSSSRRRAYPDVKRNALIYLAISAKLIEGSPANSVSSVPIMVWPTKP